MLRKIFSLIPVLSLILLFFVPLFVAAESSGEEPEVLIHMIQDFSYPANASQNGNTIAWIWAEAGAGPFGQNNISIETLDDGNRVLRGDLAGRGYGRNVVGIWINPVADVARFDEFVFWLDLSGAPTATGIRATLASDGYTNVTGPFTLIHDDGSPDTAGVGASNGDMILPTGFTGYVVIPFSSYGTPSFGILARRAEFNFYILGPVTGEHFLLDNVQFRGTGDDDDPGNGNGPGNGGPDPVVDLTFNVIADRSNQLFETNFIFGVTHTHHRWWEGHPAAVERASQLLADLRPVHNQHIMGWGAPNPWPSRDAAMNFGYLRDRVDQFIEINGEGAEIWFTLCQAPGWMKASGNDWNMDEAPLPEYEEDFAYLARQIAIAFPEVTGFQVWNEFKGMWCSVLNGWDHVRYTRLYNKVYAAIREVRPDAIIGGFYIVVDGDGSFNEGFVDVSNRNTRAPLDARTTVPLRYFLENAINVDYLLVSRWNVDWQNQLRLNPTYEQAMVLTKYFGTVIADMLEIAAEFGYYDIPFGWAEFYGSFNNTPVNSQYIGAHYASIYYNMIMGARGREQTALLWMETENGGGQRGQINHAIFTHTNAAETGGLPTPHFFAVQKLTNYFPPGTMLYEVKITSEDIEPERIGHKLEVLVSATHAYVINKTNSDITVVLNGETLELAPFAVEVFKIGEEPVFGFDIFNNGKGGSQSRPNPGLATAGIIRMWTQLDGINTPVYLAASETIEALDQDGNCAEEFIRVGRVWQAGTGWLDYFNLLDVNKDGGSWRYINLY
ncbi:MAG: hypothetical protein FWC32_02505, partial [Firmicutes bacterium]|nr:hypothetical protein [Bacillota bacterium]